ncbi:MAG TPA: DUF3099 domain-containing protein [Nocardioides sp.]|nr:DUF3099 domain-containing protein [Nocardioides sp.]
MTSDASAPDRRSVDIVERAARRRAYFWLMGTCIVLIVLAWNVVRLWSTTAAVVMSVVAAVIPPTAAIIANTGALDDSARRAGDEHD